MFLIQEEGRKEFQKTRRTVRVLSLAMIVTGIGTRQNCSVRACSKVFFVTYTKPLFPNCGSARNGAVNTNKKFKFPRKIPNIAKISRVFLSGNWQYWSKFRALPSASVF